MARPEDLHKALEARLRTIPSISVYVGEVNPKPPAEPGSARVYPYAVVWPSGGFTPPEGRSIAGRAGEALEWPCQVTVAAGDVDWCLQAVRLVRDVLEGHVLVPGAGALQEEPTGAMIAPDRDVSPVRFFVPLMFRNLSV